MKPLNTVIIITTTVSQEENSFKLLWLLTLKLLKRSMLKLMKLNKFSLKRLKRFVMNHAKKDVMPKQMRWSENWRTQCMTLPGTVKTTITPIPLIMIQNITISIEFLWMLWQLKELLIEFKPFKNKSSNQITSDGKMLLTLMLEMVQTLTKLF